MRTIYPLALTWLSDPLRGDVGPVQPPDGRTAGEGLRRSTFERWEMDILLDIESCHLSRSNWERVLRRYQRAVQRGLRKGALAPLKLSEYLGLSKERRFKRKPAAAERSNGLDLKTGTH
jgi:hypothetical protein